MYTRFCMVAKHGQSIVTKLSFLKQFQQRCLRSICRIKFSDKVSNVDVLERCVVLRIESQIIKAHLRCVGQV